MDYKDFFSPSTLEKLNKKSAENLKSMLGDKSLTQTIMSSQQLLSQIAKAEAPYKQQLEKLAVDMVKELYPIIDEEGIVLDAKLGSTADVGRELDEIKVNKPATFFHLTDRKSYNITVKNTPSIEYPNYKYRDSNDLTNLKYFEKGSMYPFKNKTLYVFISNETGEVIEIPKNKLISAKEISKELDEIKINKPKRFSPGSPPSPAR
jgi:hypothetical protein